MAHFDASLMDGDYRYLNASFFAGILKEVGTLLIGELF